MVDLKQMSKNLLGNLSQIEGKKIFIFGDIGIDEYVKGQVSRISPEAPVPVLEVDGTDKKLGLSGNVAANVKSLGGEPLLFSTIGEDQNAESLKALLKESEISPDFLMVDPSRQTTSKLRVMTGHHHIVRVDYESKKAVSKDILDKYAGTIEEQMKLSDGVIIQDYAKGLVNEYTSQWVIEKAKGLGKPVLVDPYRSTTLRAYKGADFMTPNRDEALELAKQIPKPEIWDNVDAIGLELMKSIEAPQMVITLGPEGVKIFDDQGTFHLPTFAKKVFDVTGAGDTVIAAYSLGMGAGWELRESAFFANMAAGGVVGHVGAVACQLSELRESLEQL